MINSGVNVLIAGIGGASLGTEIFKCLRIAGGYNIYGCDISKYAYGHYQEGFVRTFLVDRSKYIDSVKQICLDYGIKVVVPGGEEPSILMSSSVEEFEKEGIFIAGNSPEVVRICSDKAMLFKKLEELGVPIPKTFVVSAEDDLRKYEIPYPCVVKPASGTGGSHLVFFARNPEDARMYVRYILENGAVSLVQEYIGLDEGEYTVGVLSLTDGFLVGSIAMQRIFHTKLSIALKLKDALISSGYSQGLIEDFPGIRAQAEKISKILGSRGPMNIQGRVKNDVFLPFEINPRFSASTYLRALAGFNEVDMFIRYIIFGEKPKHISIRPGYYLRSLSELYVPKEDLKQ